MFKPIGYGTYQEVYRYLLSSQKFDTRYWSVRPEAKIINLFNEEPQKTFKTSFWPELCLLYG